MLCNSWILLCALDISRFFPTVVSRRIITACHHGGLSTLSFLFRSKITREWRRVDTRRVYESKGTAAVHYTARKTKKLFSDWTPSFNYFSMRSRRRCDVRSSGHRRKKYRRPIFIRRGKLSAAVFRSRLSRCVLSRCVLLTLFHYRWAGRGFGQVDTPNPRTVRNRGWCLTGVRAWKAFFFLFHAAWCFDSHSILINLQIIWLDIAKKYVGTIFNSKIHRNVERAFNDTII